MFLALLIVWHLLCQRCASTSLDFLRVQLQGVMGFLADIMLSTRQPLDCIFLQHVCLISALVNRYLYAMLQDAAVRGSIKLVQIKGPNTGWQGMNNVWGASWESTSIPEPPLDFRIQDDQGTEV